MKILQTDIPDLVVVETIAHSDVRGSFARLYCELELDKLIAPRRVVQINHSYASKKGTLRGLHFQSSPYAEMKLVRCLRGRVWDVAVDLRNKSPTFLKWYGVELTPMNMRMIVIPEGFAHGFQVMESDSELLYLHTALYSAQAEGGLRYNDPKLDIQWPLPVAEISERDCNQSLINSDYKGIDL